ncbi:hypothetical protein DFH94DRAFT_742485 [Russula ochroleuca]|uniref:Uncharacterized protein n=1 Tax=Russula ochroleuca TaxID=152965 RepID=A0A9P5MWN0_9AGAM|nr:hypothetical protein DFH94DRAFT_742485 [Russula ochroleuca]
MKRNGTKVTLWLVLPRSGPVRRSRLSGARERNERPVSESDPTSPPPHTTLPSETPTFSAFRPRDVRITSTQAITQIAWSCDGKKLAAVGIDRMVRVFQPEKSMETRSASLFLGAHSDEVDYVAWNPTHPELFCSSSQKDRRIVFWDARRISRALSPARSTTHSQGPPGPNQLRAGRRIIALCIIWEPAILHVLREGFR